MKTLLLGLMFVSSFTFALGDLPSFPHIMVNADAQTKVSPTKAQVNFSITEFNEDPKVAEDTVIKRLSAILSLAKKYNIPRENIVLQSMQKNIKRKTDPSYNQLQILGYDISQSISVTINSIASYPGFADDLIASRNVNSIYASFDVVNKDDIQNDLTKMATKNAKKKAEVLAQGMDVKLDGVFAVSQDKDFTNPLAEYQAESYKVASAPAPAGGSEEAIALVPKYIEFSASVSVIYKIKP